MLSALKTKRARVGLGLLVLLAFSGAAVAYFTTTGSGSANAQVGTSSALTITASLTPATGLVPGGTPAAVSFSVSNPSSGNQYVGTVSLSSVSAYSDAGHTTSIPVGTGAGQCDTSQFTMAPVAENQDVPSGTTSLGTNGSLVFHDSGTNQNGCKGAYLVANFTSN